jgi:two-component system, sensor histidine kinase PdtaS
MSEIRSKKSPVQIDEEEQFSSRLIQNMPDGVTVSDASGRHTQVNPALCKMTGFSEKELLGHKSPHPYWPKEIHTTILKSFQNLRTGPAKEIETVFIRKNGERFPVLIHASVSKNDKGEITSFVAMVKDITELKKSQEILKENVELYKNYYRLINSIDGVLWETTLPDFKTIFISEQTEKILGYSVKEWLRDENFWKNHVHPDDREWADTYSTEMSLKGKSHTLEYRFLKKNGEIIWLRDIVNVEIDEGQAARLRGVFVDITAQRLAQAKIEKLNEELEKKVIQRTKKLNAALLAKKESEKLYRSMFVNNHAVMLLIDPDDSSIVDANPAACKYYGFSHEEICSIKITDINVSPKPSVSLMMKNVLSEEIRRFEAKHKLSSGELRDVEIYSGPIVIRKNLLFSIIHDITERIKAQEEIKKNIKTQEVLLKEVNHRVKNNLAALIGILHIEQDRLKKSGNDSYINLLTDLTSRIQGLLTVHQLFSLRNWQPIEISQLCERIIKSAFSGMSMTMKLNLVINSSDILVPSRIAHHLTLVINELATNSLKHALGNRKIVRINVNVARRGKKVRISYKDDGIGFPKEFIKGDFRQANIGFELIRGIVVQSLEGTLSLQNKDGAIALITFENQTD